MSTDKDRVENDSREHPRDDEEEEVQIVTSPTTTRVQSMTLQLMRQILRESWLSLPLPPRGTMINSKHEVFRP